MAARLRTDKLVIPQGATWGTRWPLRDSTGAAPSIFGWAARAQARPTVASEEILHEWNEAAGNLTVTDEGVTILVSPTTSSAWEWLSAVYDLELFHTDGTVVRLTQGSISVSPEVTR